MSDKVIRCDRCNRRMRGSAHNWNSVVKDLRIVGYLCPDCQTPDEAEQAEHRYAEMGRRAYIEVDGEGNVVRFRRRHRSGENDQA